MTAAPLPGTHADEQAFLDSVEGEISFFRSIMRARPLGKHRHFHILTVRNFILRDTGRSVHIDSIWEKLRKCYNIDALEAVTEPEVLSPAAHNHVSTSAAAASASSATSAPLQLLSPSESLALHPFTEEFSLPYEDFDSLFAQRRMRESASLPSSPAPTPGAVEGAAKTANVAAGNTTSRRASASSSTVPTSSAVTTARTGKRKLGKSKLNLAGLVGGDSDSSALTQESGDEGGEDDGSGVAETPKESVVAWTGTGTDADGRTEDGEEEETEMREASSVRESPRPIRGRGAKAGGRRGRGATGITRGSSRGKKKQKR